MLTMLNESKPVKQEEVIRSISILPPMVSVLRSSVYSVSHQGH